MMAPAAFGRVRYCRFAHAETACAKPMHNKDFGRTDSEGFSAHSEPSRTPAAHARWRPASWSRLCEVLDRILAGVQLRHQTSPAGDRERSLPGQAAHAAGGRLPGLLYGAADDPGVRGHAVAAQGLRLCGRLDGVRAEPAARALLRASRG